MSVTVQMFTNRDRGRLLATVTAGQVRFGTNRHGYAQLSVDGIPANLLRGLEGVSWPGLPHLVVVESGSGRTVWEGRLEDVVPGDGVLSVQGVGYAAALNDIYYTALWSDTSSTVWEPMPDDRGLADMDTNNRLWIAPVKGAAWGAGRKMRHWYRVPHRGRRDLRWIEFDYDVTLPSADWEVVVERRNRDTTVIAGVWTLAGTGSAQTGSVTLALAACEAVSIGVRSVTAQTYSGETGDAYARITAFRVATTTDGVVRPDLIVADVVSAVNTANPLQLRNETAEIATSSVTLTDAMYEDLRPAEVLGRVAALDGWEWSVWRGQRLRYGPPADEVVWRVDAGEITGVARSAAGVESAGYATFRNRNNQTLRTTQVTDSVLAERLGAVRVVRVDTQTTSEARAEAERDGVVAGMWARRLRAGVDARRVYRPEGGLGRVWDVRAGQVVELRNWPVTVTQTADALRRWRVGETVVDVDAARVALVSAEPLPDLVNMVS